MRNLFRTSPLLAQCLVGGSLFVSGDVISQTIFEGRRSLGKIDLYRSVAFGVYGFCISVPLTASWYKILDKFLVKNGVKTLKDTLSQVILDQVLFAPLGIAVYFICTNILLAMKVNYVTWPWIQLVNFHFVPLVYRTVVVNTAALGWNSYMSWLNHHRHGHDRMYKTT